MAVNRATFTSTVLLIQSQLSLAQRLYQEAGIPATSGKKINTLSDDSTSISRLLNFRSDLVANEQYQKNITELNRRLVYVDAQLSGASDVLQKLRELTLGAADPNLNESLRNQLSQQVDDLKDQFRGFANARQEGKYIFSGTAISTAPFQDTGGGLIAFMGNSDISSIRVSSSLTLQTSIDGNETFTGNIDTAIGGSLATTLKNNDGVSLGIEAGDIISFGGNVTGAIGGTLTVTNATTLTDIAAALQVAIRAAGAGTETVAVQGTGSLLVTSGATAITGLNMSITGNTTFNTAFTFPTPIAAAGGTGASDALLTGTGEDIFDVFDDLSDAIRTGDLPGIGTHLTRLDSGIEQILNARSVIGLRSQQVDSVENNLTESNIQTLSALSDLQDANLDEVLSNLVLKETALKAVFASASRILGIADSLQLNT